MIKLGVADYCHSCPGFIPIAEKIEEEAKDEYGYDIWECHFVVVCKNKKHCEAIVDYLKKKEN